MELRKYTNWNYAYLIILLLCNEILCQTTGIQGYINEEGSNESINDVSIYLHELNTGAVSDRNGFFNLPRIKPGQYTVSASHIGYAFWEESILVEDGKPVILEIKLKPKIINLDSVVVTQQRFTGNQIGKHRLTPQFIRRIPSAGEPDLLRAIQTLPGIVPTNDFNLGFYVRGGNRDQNLILMDDIPVFNPFHLVGIFSTFDPDAVQSVDFQKGRIHPQYGNNLSSVVNINLRDGNAKKITFNTNISLLSSRFRLEGPIKSGTFMVTIRRTYLDLIINAFNSIKIIPVGFPYNFIDGIAKFTYRPSPTSKLRFSSYFSNDVYDLSKIDGDDTENKFMWNNRAVGFAYDKQFSPGLMFHGSASNSLFYSEWLPTDTMSSITIDNDISLLQLKSYLKWNYSQKGMIQIGVEPKQYSINMDIKGLNYTPFHLGNSTFSEVSAFLFWEIPVISIGQLELGERITHFSFHNQTEYSPSVLFSINLPKQYNLSISWSKRYQGIMTIGNEEVILTMFEAWLPTPKELGIMSSNQTSIGIGKEFANGRSMSLDFYHREFSNIVEYNTQKYTIEEPDFVSGKGSSQGVEFLLRNDIGRFNTMLSYTYSETVKELQGIKYNPSYDRTHDLNILVSRPFGKKWRLGWKFVYQTGVPFTPTMGYYYQNLPKVGSFEVPLYGTKNSVRLPNYHRLDANFSRQISIKRKAFTLYIDIINIYARLNVLMYSRSGETNIQTPPIITFGIKTKI